jgi:hypothetical protein
LVSGGQAGRRILASSARQARDQSDIRSTGREEPVGAGLRVGACSIDGFNDHSIVMRFGWSLEDVGPSIDKETDIGGIGRLSSAPYAVDLIDCRAERSIRRKAVLQLAAYRPRVLVLSQP